MGGNLVERHARRGQAFGERFRGLPAARGKDGDPRASFEEMLRRQTRNFPGADHEDKPAVKAPENLFTEPDRDGTHGNRRLGQLRFRPDAFADRQSPLEEGIQQLSRHPLIF